MVYRLNTVPQLHDPQLYSYSFTLEIYKNVFILNFCYSVVLVKKIIKETSNMYTTYK